MSITGIASNLLFSALSANQSPQQNGFQQLQSEFQQLGQDLSAGNLSQAQQDFSTLTQNLPPQLQSNANANASPVSQALNALSTDLQSGNLSAAQQDLTTLQQDLQQAGSGHHRHHFGQSGASSAQSEIAQGFSQLGQDLESGNLSSAQQAYATLQQEFQQYAPNFAEGASASSGSTNIVV